MHPKITKRKNTKKRKFPKDNQWRPYHRFDLTAVPELTKKETSDDKSRLNRNGARSEKLDANERSAEALQPIQLCNAQNHVLEASRAPRVGTLFTNGGEKAVC